MICPSSSWNHLYLHCLLEVFYKYTNTHTHTFILITTQLSNQLTNRPTHSRKHKHKHFTTQTNNKLNTHIIIEFSNPNGKHTTLQAMAQTRTRSFTQNSVNYVRATHAIPVYPKQINIWRIRRTVFQWNNLLNYEMETLRTSKPKRKKQTKTNH